MATDEIVVWNVSDGDTSDDGEPRLQIVDNCDDDTNKTNIATTRTLNDEANNAEAVESLLMLGMGDVWSKDASAKDSSSSKESSFTSTLIRRSSSCHEIYYQKMREKNNEASKRCRMKRRLKAVSLEGHLDLLVLSNEMLKDRLSRTEKICSVIREAIKNIQPEGCSCIQAHEIIKQVNTEYKDRLDLSTGAIVRMSKTNRNLKPELTLIQSSSDDDVSAATSPIPPSVQSSTSVSVFPVSFTTTMTTSSVKPKTVLDILNDTIIQSLGNNASMSTVKSDLPIPSLKNVVKIEPLSPFILSVPRANFPKVEIVVESEPQTTYVTNDSSWVPRNDSPAVVVKNESVLDSNCLAATVGSHCRGSPVNLNDLNSVLNTITGKPVRTSSGQNPSLSERNSASEKSIILSRMGLPFWDNNQLPVLICEGHRQTIVESPLEQVCVLCGTGRASKIDSAESITFLITQTMSEQNHFQNGKILPIGRLVCGLCKNTRLRGIDTSSSQILMPRMNGHLTSEYEKSGARNSVASVKPSVSRKRPGSSPELDHLLPVKIRPSPPCFSTSKNKLQVIIQPVQKEVSRPVDPSSNKIIRLNEALKDLNPDYDPIGFSVTSAKSCSPATLQEAVRATEAAISTIMSVIAPGQESFLWQSIRPILDEKLNSPPNSGLNNNLKS